jgi:hypothetical protein
MLLGYRQSLRPLPEPLFLIVHAILMTNRPIITVSFWGRKTGL